MAKFLDATGVSYHLQQLIDGAREKLVLISPFLKTNKKIRQSLADKNLLKIDIRIVYGKVDLQPEENNWLSSQKSIRTSYCENLHAKCYLNEREAIITSMNLYDFSQVNNQEMGIYLSKDADQELYDAVYTEVQKLIRTSDEVSISVEKIPAKESVRPSPTSEQPKRNKASNAKEEMGFCIHCCAPIDLDPSHPFCRECYGPWKKNGADEEAAEVYCHVCGEKYRSTFLKTAHYECYKKNKHLFTP